MLEWAILPGARPCPPENNAHLVSCSPGRTRRPWASWCLGSLLGMTERTLITSIGGMKLAPNMLLALVGLGISRFTPRSLLGLAFTLSMGGQNCYLPFRARLI